MMRKICIKSDYILECKIFINFPRICLYIIIKYLRIGIIYKNKLNNNFILKISISFP